LSEDSVQNSYPVIFRHKADAAFKSHDEILPSSDLVIDYQEIPFIHSRLYLKTAVERISVSDDHSLLAATLDIGNTEVLTGIVKDMSTGKINAGVKIENVG
jgi:hypothetical protein